jgi:hypothetical protein
VPRRSNRRTAVILVVAVLAVLVVGFLADKLTRPGPPSSWIASMGELDRVSPYTVFATVEWQGEVWFCIAEDEPDKLDTEYDLYSQDWNCGPVEQ